MLDNAKKSLSGQGDLLLTEYRPGDRIELAPHTVAWASGDRFGTVTAVGRFYVHVRTDMGGGKERRISPENIARKIGTA